MKPVCMKSPTIVLYMTLVFLLPEASSSTAEDDRLQMDAAPSVEPMPFDVDGRSGTIAISVTNLKPRMGEVFRVDFKVVNTSERPFDVYYKTRGRHLGRAGLLLDAPSSIVLMIYDEKGEPLADLFFRLIGYRTVPTRESDWIFLPAGGVLVKRERLFAGTGGLSPDGRFHSRLPPGKYYLRAEFPNRFLSDCPFPDLPEEVGPGNRKGYLAMVAPWFDAYGDRPVFASNVIEIEVLP